MSRGQKLVIFGWICFLILQMAFPPFHQVRDGNEILMGYKFLPSSMTPSDREKPDAALWATNIDGSLLLVQMFGSTLVFLGLFMLVYPGAEGAGATEREKPVNPGRAKGSKESEEFFDVGDD